MASQVPERAHLNLFPNSLKSRFSVLNDLTPEQSKDAKITPPEPIVVDPHY